ncbi:Uma2 family endonuclease [Oscillatoriales cyanobacterium LEGE 11467]|uniref:Uma2 family endonuclease n=1 Tax=Zarconia navalis LEGE 11467 TaxID=1828826 RepID=A0A928Z796_9CYAN|nr:Uma2 family endonuclease [Zarconia navalis]MBE9040315.1 Uma2 family endonuclease [Zarconia navalis LEGE 11467]
MLAPSGFSPQEYLFLERESPVRHEYRDGSVYAMAGNSDNHSRLSINLLTAMNLHLRDGNCQFFSGDVKVSYADAFFYYPDAFVTCDDRDKVDRYVKRYPKLIAEVLSPSTETFDKGEKFADYQQLESLEEYVLISQDTMRVECRRRVRNENGEGWETEIYEKGDRILFSSVELEVAIEELYRGMSWRS